MNTCGHNMKLINHNLKDKWILDSGATNRMTRIPELLDGTTCLVPSTSVYLGKNEKLMATRIGSFKSPKISIPVLASLVYLRKYGAKDYKTKVL